eukprot:jgi/Chlat1/7453/Chrsp6S07462
MHTVSVNRHCRWLPGGLHPPRIRLPLAEVKRTMAAMKTALLLAAVMLTAGLAGVHAATTTKTCRPVNTLKDVSFEVLASPCSVSGGSGPCIPVPKSMAADGCSSYYFQGAYSFQGSTANIFIASPNDRRSGKAVQVTCRKNTPAPPGVALIEHDIYYGGAGCTWVNDNLWSAPLTVGIGFVWCNDVV